MPSCALTGVPAEEQALELGGATLGDKDTIATLKMRAEDKLVMRQSPRSKLLTLHVELPTGRTCTVKANRFASVAIVKRLVETSVGDWAHDLWLARGRELLPGSLLLRDAGVADGDTLLLVARDMAVLVRNHVGDVMVLDHDPAKTVASLKFKLVALTRIPEEVQILTLGGIELRDRYTLEDYRVTSKSTLQVDLRR